MKYNGSPANFKAQGIIKLPRPGGKDIEFQASATPLGWNEYLDDIMPPPIPPTEFVRDKSGKLVRENNKAVAYENTTSRQFRKEEQRHVRRQMIATFVKAVSVDSRVSFDADPSEYEGKMAEYYDAIWEEMKEANFSVGDLFYINKQIAQLSNIDGKVIENIEVGFLEAPEQDETSPS